MWNESDLRSNEHYLSSSKNEASKKQEKKESDLTQRSINWATKLTDKWSLCLFQTNPWSDE